MQRMDDVTARATAQALEEILGALDDEPEGRARSLARDGIDALLRLHGEALARLVDAYRMGRLNEEWLGVDEIVGPLLATHGVSVTRPQEPALVHLTRARAPTDEVDLASFADQTTECQLCAAPVDAAHRHLLDIERRELTCACAACAILFDGARAAGTRYRAIPRRYQRLDRSALDEALWERLELPVDIVFLFMSSAANRVVAFYPGPMGTTESALPLPAWSDVVAASPILETLEPDVEALLVRRARGARDCLIVPIDECYRLAGAMRVTWQGISGGDQMRRAIDTCFRRLTALARVGDPQIATARDTHLEASWKTT